jgi:hypothetical protein
MLAQGNKATYRIAKLKRDHPDGLFSCTIFDPFSIKDSLTIQSLSLTSSEIH